MAKYESVFEKYGAEIVSDWYIAYIDNPRKLGKEYDPHAFFAEEIMENRQKAKRIAYKIAYSIKASDIMKMYEEEA